METRPAALRSETAAAPSAALAKGALRRLATSNLEPTPENYARAYAEEMGQPPRPVLPAKALALLDRFAASPWRDDAARKAALQAFAGGRWQQLEQLLDARMRHDEEHAQSLAELIERLAQGLERGGKQWTSARRKDSLRKLLAGSRSDAQRLQQRLAQLVAAWEADAADTDHAALADDGVQEPIAGGADAAAWLALARTLFNALCGALPSDDARSASLAAQLESLAGELVAHGPTAALAESLGRECSDAQRLLAQRQRLADQLRVLCTELIDSLTELAEDDSWARGQCEAMRARLTGDVGLRGVRAASELLRSTRLRQKELRDEQTRSRHALKGFIGEMLGELGELSKQTGKFEQDVDRYASAVEGADSLESLAGVVREMVAEARSVQSAVSATQQRLHAEHTRASELADRVQQLEDALRRLSDEVSTDPLTQIANRRGLHASFEAERSRVERGGGELAIALLDADNFKKLNDTLGHSIGDEALKSLAERVKQQLRPSDTVARYGGEEFVVLLPDTALPAAQDAMSRMQRAMTAALFMHEGSPVFITFSAGLTLYRSGERIEQSLERADEALYEAKRTGKNRTCVA